ncbi:MAG: DNA alkylation repair protein [Candidatus Eisenbacteria bacterium]|nr:DNA alkylation repair protein [Candidatus Eisenbacteria bacterium]
MEQGRLTKEERKNIRDKTLESLNALTPESGIEATAGIAPLLVPDPKAAPGQNGLRVGRETILEVIDAVDKKIRSKAKRSALVEALWSTGSGECRVAAALLLPPLLPAPNEEEEAIAVERVRAYLAATDSPAVREALADAVSRELEAGRDDSWNRAFKVWRSETDPRYRVFGVAAYARLLSRGKAPEKLFDGLMVARRHAADSDPMVRRSVVQLLLAGARRQALAVSRFVARFEEDDREEVRALAVEVLPRVRRERDQETGAAPGEADGAGVALS